MIVSIFLLMVMQVTTVYGDTAVVANVLIPEQLTIELGPEWAGMEFELETEYGLYPGTIPANESGTVSLEIGGSSYYTLRSLGAVSPPVSEPTTQPDDPIITALPEAILIDPSQETVEEWEGPPLVPTLIACFIMLGIPLAIILWRRKHNLDER